MGGIQRLLPCRGMCGTVISVKGVGIVDYLIVVLEADVPAGKRVSDTVIFGRSRVR